MLFLAAICYGSVILHDFAEVMQWSAHWPKNVHRVPAYVLAGLGLFLYWFWMLRIAHSSPPETRGRVSRFFGLWAPLEAALLIGGWIVGQHHGLPYLAKLLKMGFYE